MASGRCKSTVDVHLLLVCKRQVLLQLRQNTGYEDGSFHFPAGHVEEGENALEAVIREADEELGLALREDWLELVYTLHRQSDGSRVSLFFACHAWAGAPTAKEPHKCAELRWCAPDALPARMVPYARHAFEQIRTGKRFGTFGWPGRTALP